MNQGRGFSPHGVSHEALLAVLRAHWDLPQIPCLHGQPQFCPCEDLSFILRQRLRPDASWQQDLGRLAVCFHSFSPKVILEPLRDLRGRHHVASLFCAKDRRDFANADRDLRVRHGWILLKLAE